MSSKSLEWSDKLGRVGRVTYTFDGELNVRHVLGGYIQKLYVLLN